MSFEKKKSMRTEDSIIFVHNKQTQKSSKGKRRVRISSNSVGLRDLGEITNGRHCYGNLYFIIPSYFAKL